MVRTGVAQTCVLAFVCGALGAGAVTRLASVTPVAAQTQQVLMAQEFRLINQNGTVAGSLKAENGFTQLILNNSSGVMRVLVQVSPDGTPFAMFWDRAGNGSYEMGFRTPSVNFLDPQNRIMASLPWTSSGRPAMTTLSPVEPLPPLGQSSREGGYRPYSTASGEDIRTLWGEIDVLRDRVSQLLVRVNALSH